MNRRHTNETSIFIVNIFLLFAVSLVGIIAPESISHLQNSNPLKWSVAILGGLIFSYVSVWLLIAAPIIGTRESKSKGHYMREIMVTDIRRSLYFQPFLVLLVGWILGWGTTKIISIVSFINFVTICASFFRALRLWELNGKKHKASLQT